MILPEQYQFVGEVGEQQRFNHEECGDTRRRLYVARTSNGYLFHCHNCAPAFSGRCRTSNNRRLSNRDLLSSQEVTKDESILSLPEDYTPRISDAGVAWLMKYGITPDEIKRFKIGYSPSANRVILPVYRDGALIFWQGRALGEAKPKYLSPHIKGDNKWFVNPSVTSTTVVLVEDVLSAIKVGRVSASIALLGSHIPNSILDICSQYDKIILWLDYDKRVEAVKYAKRLHSLLGKQILVVATQKDPKEYPTEEIHKELEAVLTNA